MLRKWLNRNRARGNNRPQRNRLDRYFDCTWLSPWREEQSRVSSLSENGCYIESRFTLPAEGTLVPEINIALPGGTVTLQGTVLNATPGVGFAVRFTELDTDTRARLIELLRVNRAGEQPSSMALTDRP